tara:strand:- start:108 stop:287 length:180 start_codon:yes stop_codon:yes gene_type:complete
MKTIMGEIIDDKDEYLKSNKKNNQDNPNIIKRSNDNASIIPKYVATPLPPLNFNHRGYM